MNIYRPNHADVDADSIGDDGVRNAAKMLQLLCSAARLSGSVTSEAAQAVCAAAVRVHRALEATRAACQAQVASALAELSTKLSSADVDQAVVALVTQRAPKQVGH